jgi:hypothetical protein
MKIASLFFALGLAMALVLGGCHKTEKTAGGKFPATPPDQVVLKFYSLLAQGGKLTLKEAHQMVTDKFGPVDEDAFRKWVQDFTKDTKIRILETKLPAEKTRAGYYIASVKMEVATPSVFGDPFISASQMNLILDEKVNEWKIDFLAQTIDKELEFKKAPAEAKI